MPEPSSNEEQLRQAAHDSMRDPAYIRERVRVLTLQALRERQFDAKGFREVMSAMTEGISKGATSHRQDTKEALRSAFSGLDDAFTRAAHASSLAVKELAAKGKDFSDGELKQALEQMRGLEADFMQTWGRVTESASDTVKTEMRNLMTHMERTGTDTGRVIGATMQEFSNRMGSAWMRAQTNGMDAARTMSARFTQAASGFFGAMSDVLRRDDSRRDK